MNNQILQVNVIPVEDNFVHLSSKLIRQLNILEKHDHPVTTIDSVLGEFYVSYSQTPCNSNGNYAFNISHELLSSIGLYKSQNVLITVIDQIPTLERIHVSPVTIEDWDLLNINNVSLQENILQQIQIVYSNQIVPLWISKFVHIKICIVDLENNLQFGLLKELTEIFVKPNILSSVNNPNNKNNNYNENVDNSMQKDLINQNNNIPITKYQHQFIYRTIILNETLLKSDYILYPYCALISKLHMPNFKQNDNNMFVKISLIQDLDQIKNENSQNKSKIKNPTLIIRLCPLDSFMNNVEEMEVIKWPTIYITNVLSKMMGLKMNSKIVLESISQIDNEICDIKNIYISPIKKMKIDIEINIIDNVIENLKNEILRHKVLVLNNQSLLQVIYNKILTMDVIVTFSQSNIPYIFLNEYNFGIIKFTNKIENKSFDILQNLIEKINKTQPIESLTFDGSILEKYDSKCFKNILKIGSLCLNVGLQSYTRQTQSFFEFDNLLITGSVASGKTSVAKLLCHQISKFPYFVKIIWINGRFYAGKLWETFQKQIINSFQECLYYQPAVIVIDDFDDLCHLNSEPNEHVDMYKVYLRSLHLLMKIIENYTNNKYCIRVICTAKPMSQEIENLFTKQLKHIFKTVIHIPLIDKESRKEIISKRLNKIKFSKDIDEILIQICEKMDNYVIQDIIDYCDKVVFETFMDNSNLNKTILTNVFEKTIPLSLHNVNICKENKFNFSFIGGLKDAKQIITETIIWPSLYSDVFRNCPLKVQSGVLLYGPPGTGKTLLARAIIGESHLNFISVNGPELLSKFVGESENNLRKIFQRAQNAKPCIIFFDEFESISPKRGSDQTGVTDRVVNQFLTQLDGVNTFDGVWVIAATSRPDLIDQALLRPGRIGVKLQCDIPTANDREDIIKVLCNKVRLSKDVNFHNIGAETNGYTGADLNGLLYTAISIAEKRLLNEQNDTTLTSEDSALDNPIITADDFQNAIKITKPSLQQTDINRYAQIHRIFSGKKTNVQNNKHGDFIVDVKDENRVIQQKTTFA